MYQRLIGSKGYSKDSCAVLHVHFCIFKHRNSIVQALVIMAAWILLNFMLFGMPMFMPYCSSNFSREELSQISECTENLCRMLKPFIGVHDMPKFHVDAFACGSKTAKFMNVFSLKYFLLYTIVCLNVAVY